MQPQQFTAKWQNTSFGEKQASQEMFLDICTLVEHPTPGAMNNPDVFAFEKWVPGGFADAYLEGHFGWEFKGSDADLDDALNQLLKYQVHLKTPPLLIVSSFNTIRIQTNFPGMVTARHVIPVPDLDQKENLDKLRWAFHAPAEFRPDRTVDAVTRETADLFFAIVQGMEQQGVDSDKLARYLNQIMFCLYAEDAGLLSNRPFSRTIQQHFHNPERFDQATTQLFGQMANGGLFGADEVAHFNGDLFNSVDTVKLSLNALYFLNQAAEKDWRNIEPSIFGTLFERVLDASKRSQLGAHYTGADDIKLVVEPVVMDPLRREWDAARQETDNLIAEENIDAARVRLEQFQQRLFEVTVLDPACGSGNFLFVALRSLLDLDKEVIDFAAARGWRDLTPRIKPDQMMGLEINPYATELARTALWIGYIQWHQANGFSYNDQPILTPLDTIRQTDAILDLSDPENPAEPQWPAAEFIIGNPPFLAPSCRFENNWATNTLTHVFQTSMDPHGSPIPATFAATGSRRPAPRLPTANPAKRAGLLATQGIRWRQSNRPGACSALRNPGTSSHAISDQNWVSRRCSRPYLNRCLRRRLRAIHRRTLDYRRRSIQYQLRLDCRCRLLPPPSASSTDLEALAAFMGVQSRGPFDIPDSLATEMLKSARTPTEGPNSDVVRRWINGRDITQRPREMWMIDFGVDMSVDERRLYEAPFEYVRCECTCLAAIEHKCDSVTQKTGGYMASRGNDYASAQLRIHLRL